MRNSLQEGWTALDELSRGEYALCLEDVLDRRHESLGFMRVGRIMAVSIKCPFALPFPYDPDLPLNWARSQRCWEIRGVAAPETIQNHRLQLDLLLQIADDWDRPIEFLAEYNIFHSLCKRLRSVICGEAKGLENAEKIAEDLKKAGTEVAVFSPNQLLGAASLTVAAYLSRSIPLLGNYDPLVTGATLLLLCFGQRKLCKLLTTFEKSYDKEKDPLANRKFPMCGSRATKDKQPCRNRVQDVGDRCWIHAKQGP